MTFQEIFQEKGLYRADSFASGVVFEINEYFQLYTVEYKNENDLQPLKFITPMYKGLFDKDYQKVFTRQSLFK